MIRTLNWSHPQRASIYAEHARTIQAVAWSPDSSCLISGDAEGTIHRWEAATGRTQAIFIHDQPAPVGALAWSPDGLIASGGKTHRLQILEGARLQVIHEWPLHGTPGLRPNGAAKYGRPVLGINALAWPPDGRLLLGGGFGQPGHYLTLWEGFEGRERLIDPAEHRINAVAWSPDGERFAAAGDFGELGIWSKAGKRFPLQFAQTSPQHFFSSIAWSPDGKRLAGCGQPGFCAVWYGTGEQLQVYKGHQGQVLSLAWSPDSEHIASTSQDGVQIWDARTGQELAAYPCLLKEGSPLAWSPDGRCLAAALADCTIHVWEPQD